jgi:hypothetical protein
MELKYDLQRCFVVDIAVIGRNATDVPGPGLALGISPTRLAALFNCLLPKIQVLNTAKTKCRKLETNIPRKGISGPQSQFPHSCSKTHECGNWG